LRERLLGQIPERQIHAEVTSDLFEQGDRRGGERPTDVVGHLCIEPHGRDARPRDRHLDHRQCGRRHAQQSLRSLLHIVVQQSGLRCGTEHVHRPCVGHRRRDRSEAHPLHDAESHRGLHHLLGELLPAEVWLGPEQHEQIAAALGPTND
jgi:hypothetical protein